MFILLGCIGLGAIKQKTFHPPGTVPVSDSFFVDETEISNLSWLEFEFSTAVKYGKGSKEHRSVLPDTSVWKKAGTACKNFNSTYYRGLKYRDYPVVGISYDQAKLFCLWRTEMVKLYCLRFYHKEIKVEFRLPKKEEWERVSYYNSQRLNPMYTGNKAQCNLWYPNENALYHGPMPVKSFDKEFFKTYQTIGNVAEMLEERNICKGGSWLHLAEQSRTGKDLPYAQPECWLGFRCVCVIH